MLVSISLAVAATLGGKALHSHNSAFAAPVTGLSLPGVGASIPASSETTLRHDPINRTVRADQPVPQSQQDEANLLVAASAASAAPSPTEAPPPPPQAQEDAVVRAAATPAAPDLPLYQVYTVVENDTVSGIAQAHGLEPEYIMANNAELTDGLLVLGQSIILPPGNGILHEIRFGETLSDIATRYDVPLDAITSFAPNHIASANEVKETQVVYVPGGKPIPAAAPAEPEPTATEDAGTPSSDEATPVPTEDTSGDGSDGGGSSSGDGSSSGGVLASSSGLIWPVYGPISSYYGPSHPLGIDIDGFNLAGASIGAATSGTVVFAGGNACCSYGLYVVIMSPNGIETLYAHLSSISVSQGETVSQGESIGIIGSTGYSTGRHLHFEVIDNGVREDPLSYLP